VLAVRENQSHLSEDIERAFAWSYRAKLLKTPEISGRRPAGTLTFLGFAANLAL
jgi:hypothetical protein